MLGSEPFSEDDGLRVAEGEAGLLRCGTMSASLIQGYPTYRTTQKHATTVLLVLGTSHSACAELGLQSWAERATCKQSAESIAMTYDIAARIILHTGEGEQDEDDDALSLRRWRMENREGTSPGPASSLWGG
ncbi:hypothetical protein M758_UG209100 [Ceratodon purpureus]|nr:hypothetical protein M758_UG209100 [Ceratodon purpureus]